MKHEIGLKYNKLTVLRTFKKGKLIHWECLCDCGKIKSMYSHSVYKGYTKSCGCIRSYESSVRMKTKNPMWMEGIREKSIATNKKLGTRPLIRGGNGQKMPLAQKILLKALGKGWYPEYSVATHLRKINPEYPTCYKIDIADPLKKISVEVDGLSHGALSRKIQDRKKDNFLCSVGWIVHRIRNKDVISNLKDVLIQING